MANYDLYNRTIDTLGYKHEETEVSYKLPSHEERKNLANELEEICLEASLESYTVTDKAHHILVRKELMRNLSTEGGIRPPWILEDQFASSTGLEEFVNHGLKISPELIGLVIENTISFARGNMGIEQNLPKDKLSQEVPYGVDVLGYNHEHLTQFIKSRSLETLYFLTAPGKNKVRLTSLKYEMSNYCKVCAIGSHCPVVMSKKDDINPPRKDNAEEIYAVNHQETFYLSAMINRYNQDVKEANFFNVNNIQTGTFEVEGALVEGIIAIEMTLAEYRKLAYSY